MMPYSLTVILSDEEMVGTVSSARRLQDQRKARAMASEPHAESDINAMEISRCRDDGLDSSSL